MISYDTLRVRCVKFDILVFFLFLRTFYKIIKLKATIYTLLRLKIRVLG